MNKTKTFIEFIKSFNEFMEDKTMRFAFVNYINDLGKDVILSQKFVDKKFINLDTEEDSEFIKKVDLETISESENDYYYQEVDSFSPTEIRRNPNKYILFDKKLYEYKNCRYFNSYLRNKLLRKNPNGVIKRYVKVCKHDYYTKNENNKNNENNEKDN